MYVADIDEKNAEEIAERTLSSLAFPLPNPKWLQAQAGRHWRENEVVANDAGRRPFMFSDHLPNCAELASEGMCLLDANVTRAKCLRSCEIFTMAKFEFTFEEYVPGRSIEAFFDSLKQDDSCVDESDECEKHAAAGKCLTDSGAMESLGCKKSCLYCFAEESRELFSLGVDQVTGVEEDEDAPPESAVAEVMARMEFYFVNEVLVYDELRFFRLGCRNFEEECSVWAADGCCDSSKGYMGQNCPAACRFCPMVDPAVRESP